MREIWKPFGWSCARLSLAATLAVTACTPTSKPKQDAEPLRGNVTTTTKEPTRILPLSGPVYFNNGAHITLNEAVESALDFGPGRVVSCPGGTTIDEQDVIAPVEGTITRARHDPTLGAGIVEIKEAATGQHFGLLHVGKILERIQVGAVVRIGELLGKPACIGRTWGIHVHIYLMDQLRNFISIDGLTLSEWAFKGNSAVRGSEKRFANASRVPEAYLGIYGYDGKEINQVVQERVEQPRPGILSPTPTRARPTPANPKPAPGPPPQTKEPTPTPLPPCERRPEPGSTRFNSTLYCIDYPATWRAEKRELRGGPIQNFIGKEINQRTPNQGYFQEVSVDNFPSSPKLTTLRAYKEHILSQLRADTEASRNSPIVQITLVGDQFLSKRIDGVDAWQIEYHAHEIRRKMRTQSIFTLFMKEGRRWDIHFSVGTRNPTEQEIARKEGVIAYNKMLDSFRFK